MKEKKLVFGVGINDSEYPVTKSLIIEGKPEIVWICPYYVKWRDMLRRCYYAPKNKKKAIYSESTVVLPWLRFTNFKAWMETQDWQGKSLDKDILKPGNKIYGPDFCVFVDQQTNNFLLERSATQGNHPVGVHYDEKRKKYVARGVEISTGKRKNLGRFDTPQEAHQKWLTFKLEQAKILASQQTDARVAAALINRYENYHSYFGDK